LRQALGLFANLRPATMFPGLEDLSALRPEVARAIDLLIVRELNGDVYFGEKAIRTLDDGRRQGFDLMSYAEDEVRRIAHVAFRAAQGRGKRLTSVDKANVLETSQLWRDVVIEVAAEYPDVECRSAIVDAFNADIYVSPERYDVVVTTNMFGDILSNLCSALAGGLGLGGGINAGASHAMGNASHGSAPDIAGRDSANPISMIVSGAMLLGWLGRRHGRSPFAEAEGAILRAVDRVLADPQSRTVDVGGSASTTRCTRAVVQQLLA
jgi:3-isopropylmalate dehydrogenase